MDITGKWKCRLVQVKNEQGEPVWIERDKFIELMGESDEFSIFNAVLMFCDDGLMRTLFPVPESASQQELDALTASGQIYGGMFSPNEAVEWKYEGGKLLAALGEDGEWAELGVIGDMLELAVFRFEKV